MDETTTQTQPLTAQQAHVLNDLAGVCSDLRRKIQDVIDTATEQLARATEGHHLSGFDGDLFGQARYNADALAVERKMLIRTAHVAGAHEEAIVQAVIPDPGSKHVGGVHYFEAGEMFTIPPADQA